MFVFFQRYSYIVVTKSEYFYSQKLSKFKREYFKEYFSKLEHERGFDDWNFLFTTIS